MQKKKITANKRNRLRSACAVCACRFESILFANALSNPPFLKKKKKSMNQIDVNRTKSTAKIPLRCMTVTFRKKLLYSLFPLLFKGELTQTRETQKYLLYMLDCTMEGIDQRSDCTFCAV